MWKSYSFITSVVIGFAIGTIIFVLYALSLTENNAEKTYFVACGDAQGDPMFLQKMYNVVIEEKTSFYCLNGLTENRIPIRVCGQLHCVITERTEDESIRE